MPALPKTRSALPAERRILIATDFSENAMRAARYAMDLFGTQNTTYTLLHAYLYMGIVGPNMPIMDLPGIDDAEAALRLFGRHLSAGKGKLKLKVEIGSLPTVIDEFAAKHNVDLVVMGHQGVTGLAFMGGSTTAVIKQCNVPVLAVPDTALEGPVRRIVLLSDHGELLPGVLAPLRDIALRTGAEVSITHVAEDAKPPVRHWSDPVLELQLKDVNYGFRILAGTDVLEVMERITKEEKVDLIAVLHRKRDLLGSLFHSSTAKRLVMHGRVPLLVLGQ